MTEIASCAEPVERLERSSAWWRTSEELRHHVAMRHRRRIRRGIRVKSQFWKVYFWAGTDTLLNKPEYVLVDPSEKKKKLIPPVVQQDQSTEPLWGTEWRRPFLLRQRTGLIRFPRNAVARMYELNPVASRIATAKKGKADALIPNASLPQSCLYYFPCWQTIWGCCIPESDFENTKCVPVCGSRVWTPRFFHQAPISTWLHNTTPTVLSW